MREIRKWGMVLDWRCHNLCCQLRAAEGPGWDVPVWILFAKLLFTLNRVRGFGPAYAKSNRVDNPKLKGNPIKSAFRRGILLLCGTDEFEPSNLAWPGVDNEAGCLSRHERNVAGVLQFINTNIVNKTGIQKKNLCFLLYWTPRMMISAGWQIST